MQHFNPRDPPPGSTNRIHHQDPSTILPGSSFRNHHGPKTRPARSNHKNLPGSTIRIHHQDPPVSTAWIHFIDPLGSTTTANQDSPESARINYCAPTSSKYYWSQSAYNCMFNGLWYWTDGSTIRVDPLYCLNYSKIKCKKHHIWTHLRTRKKGKPHFFIDQSFSSGSYLSID